MDYSLILNNICKHIALNEEESSFFISLLKYEELPKKQVISQEGEICKSISYVHSGALRAYFLDKESNEKIIMFAIDDWWVTDMYSFIHIQPALLSIDAIENSCIFQLSKEGMEELFIKIPKFEKFFRIIMQNSYIREQLRVIQNLSLSAEERYINFLKKYPQVVNRVPQKYIASYLGITPEFLSVIRKKQRKS